MGYVSFLEGRCSTVSERSKGKHFLKWNVAVCIGTDDGFAGPYVNGYSTLLVSYFISLPTEPLDFIEGGGVPFGE